MLQIIPRAGWTSTDIKLELNLITWVVTILSQGNNEEVFCISLIFPQQLVGLFEAFININLFLDLFIIYDFPQIFEFHP